MGKRDLGRLGFLPLRGVHGQHERVLVGHGAGGGQGGTSAAQQVGPQHHFADPYFDEDYNTVPVATQKKGQINGLAEEKIEDATG